MDGYILLNWLHHCFQNTLHPIQHQILIHCDHNISQELSWQEENAVSPLFFYLPTFFASCFSCSFFNSFSGVSVTILVRSRFLFTTFPFLAPALGYDRISSGLTNLLILLASVLCFSEE